MRRMRRPRRRRPTARTCRSCPGALSSLRTSPSSCSTRALLDPLDFIARLCALVPPPRFNLTRFYGVFAPTARLRKLVVPAPTDANRPMQLQLFSQVPDYLDGSKYRLSWSALLRRSFPDQLRVCSLCSGPLRVLGLATEPDELAPLLERHGEPLEPPPLHPARAPPQLEFEPFDETA